MATVPVTLCGVFPVGPENYLCAVLLWEERRRFIPVWLPPVGGAQLLSRIGEWEPTRPDTHNLLVDLIEQSTSGVAAIELTSYYNGVFMAQVIMDDGAEYDCRPSDALVLSVMLGIPVESDEDVLAQASLWLSAEDAADYFDIEFDDEVGSGLDVGNGEPIGDSASGDAQADLDFENLMRQLGVEEKDLGFGDATGTTDTPDTQDDSGEEEL